MGILDMLLVTGLVILPTGLIALGVAMFGAPDFGKGFGGVSVVLGVLGVAAGVVLLIDPGSPIAIVSVLSLIVFHIALGWKVYSLSRGPVDSIGDRRRAVLFGDVSVDQQSARASEAAWVTEFTEETK
jgi:hypothetical protein